MKDLPVSPSIDLLRFGHKFTNKIFCNHIVSAVRTVVK